MSRDHDGGAGIIMMAFVMGAIGGAAAALLLSADPETRRVLGDRARDGRDRAGDAARQGAEFVRRQKDQISTAIERGREAYQEARRSEEMLAEDES